MFAGVQGMFERATKQLVQQIDPNGVLIPPSLNDSKKLKLLAVVLKKPKVWFWQKAKYRPTAFTLNDLLEKGEINPGKYTVKGTEKLTGPPALELWSIHYISNFKLIIYLKKKIYQKLLFLHKTSYIYISISID